MRTVGSVMIISAGLVMFGAACLYDHAGSCWFQGTMGLAVIGAGIIAMADSLEREAGLGRGRKQ